MSMLFDLVLDLLDAGGIGPSTDRGLLATFTFGSAALLSVCLWLLLTSPEPLQQPAWGLGVHAGAIVVGAGGTLVSILHLQRSPDRALALGCLAVNGAAIAVPSIGIFMR